MRERGYYAEVVERWIPGANIRKDFAGFVDLICLKDGETVGVQATSYSNVSARVKKITDHENLGVVRKAGWRLLVQGWDGKKLREIDLS
jgi:hypothetical protein